MKKIMYMLALLSAMTLVSCEKSSGGGGGGGGTSGGGGSTTVAGSRPDTDKTPRWFAGVTGADKYGYIDATGKMVIPAVYRYVYNFSSGVVMVVKDNDTLFIDQDGKSLGTLPSNIKPEMSYFYYNRLAFFAKDKQRCGHMDQEYNVTVPANYYAIGFSGDNGYSWCTAGGSLWGFVDREGNQVIPEQFAVCYTFFNGVNCVAIKQNNDTLWGIIDGEGKYLVEPQKKVLGNLTEGIFWYQEGNYYGLWDKNGNKLTEAVFEKLWDYRDGMACFLRNDKYGFVNTRGEEIVPPIYTDAFEYSGGYTWVKNADTELWEMIDKNGQVVLTLSTGEDIFYNHNGLTLVTFKYATSEDYRYIDTKGNTIYSWTEKLSAAPIRKKQVREPRSMRSNIYVTPQN